MVLDREDIIYWKNWGHFDGAHNNVRSSYLPPYTQGYDFEQALIRNRIALNSNPEPLLPPDLFKKS